jgi:hypothetical protein
MTMHMLGPAYSTLNTRKRTVKLTKRRQQELHTQWLEHNRWLKQNRMKKISFDEFVQNSTGSVPRQRSEFVPLQSRPSAHDDRMAAHRAIPSHGIKDTGGQCARRESPKYTGNLIKGIATMHKSNAVPVIDDQHIKDISSMRR